MSTRSSARDVWVGLIVIVAVAGLIALVGMASDGPGFLAPHRTIDVVFRDAQGIRIGSTVRVAGLDTGNVVDVDLVEVEGMLRARVQDLAAGRAGQEAAPGCEGLDSARAHRHEPRQRPLDGPVERRAGARAVDPGRGDVVLRPDHRAGGPGPGRAQPPEPHDRRGAADGRFDRAADPADARLASGNDRPTSAR